MFVYTIIAEMQVERQDGSIVTRVTEQSTAITLLNAVQTAAGPGRIMYPVEPD